MRSLLVTNDFPPKVGGIQTYLGELWRRMPESAVMTPDFLGDAGFDAGLGNEVVRLNQHVLWPTPVLARKINELARSIDASMIVLDPVLPLGALAHRLEFPYSVIVHGAEITVPGKFPVLKHRMRGVLRGATAVIAAGNYPASISVALANADLRGIIIPPGVDSMIFRPLTTAERAAERARFGFDSAAPLVVCVSRLVPRKGFDVLIEALGKLDSKIQLAIVGDGRDRWRLARLATRNGVNAKFLGKAKSSDLPAIFGMGDVFAMLCRDRWNGFEAEGFGIVFLEAASCAVPVVAGRSGGSYEAVAEGQTGYVVDPRDSNSAAEKISFLLGNQAHREVMGARARQRAVTDFDYDKLVIPLRKFLSGDTSVLVKMGAN